MRQLVKINANGLRVGEDHPLAKLTDHEVELLRGMLDEREAFIARLRAAGYGEWQINLGAAWVGLDYRGIARCFEVSAGYVHDIATCRRRAQTVAGTRSVRLPDR